MAPGEIRTYLGRERSLRGSRVGLPGLLLSVLAATAPLTGVAAVTPLAFGETGFAGQPLLFVLLAVVLALFCAGYAEMGRHVHNAGAFYSCVARGLGGTAGAAAGLVALVAYSAAQAGVYGLLGFEVSGLLVRHPYVTAHWWAVAFAAVAVVAVLGRLKVGLTGKVFGLLLLAEVALVLAGDVAEVARPAAGGVSFQAFTPAAAVAGPGLGAALCWCVAALAGFEQAPVHAEETRRPAVLVGRAMYLALAFAAVFLALGAWAMTVAAGPAHVVHLAGRQGPGLLFALLRPRLGRTFTDALTCCYVTGMLAALLSLQNAVARYAFAMGRDGLLPAAFGRTPRRGGATALGSLLQTVVSAGVVAGFAVTGHRPDSDPTVPVLHLFTWATAVGALGLTLLMSAASAAVIVFFVRRGSARFHPWRLLAAAVSGTVLPAVAALTVKDLAVLPGAGPHSPVRWVLPAVVAAAALLGVLGGLVLKRARPGVHRRAGLGNEAFQLDRAASA